MKTDSIREQIDESQSGAPAGGQAVRDIFSTDEIFRRIVATADEDFSRSTRLLFLSGVAAGLSIGLTFVARAAMTTAVGPESSLFLGNMLYPLGFILIVAGKYQLFTENTLTPVTHVLTRIASVPALLRVWGIVLFANVVGAGALAYVLANTGIFAAEAAEVARGFGEHALSVSWNDLFWKGVLAGWIVASMVWLTHAVRDAMARIAIVFILMYLIPIADLFHCIIGACEVLYLIFQGLAGWGQFGYFFSAVTLGNTVGGVILVAILNYSQTRQSRFPDRDCGQLELTWKEWLFGRNTTLPDFVRRPHSNQNQEEETEDTLQPPVIDEDHQRGNRDAVIILLQYGDYECETSRRIYKMVDEIMQEDRQIQYIYRHLPLSRRHPHAENAGMAAEAAADQGKFWEMHDELFDHQNHLEDENLLKCARHINLDTDRFQKEMFAEENRKRVLEDRRSGVRSGVSDTKNLFINGQRFEKPMTKDNIRREIERIKMTLSSEV
ncbi:formate/nitrite transporter family protein [Fodinibius saliphilus]|uniref:formate/nitrite transporter family protein n=1 Tax=Fodinibius saliphilus TaxID=1920650 RepID=UPI001107CB33|nr:formate/nitrite transporter family protein [Fodinibius saliphilus]